MIKWNRTTVAIWVAALAMLTIYVVKGSDSSEMITCKDSQILVFERADKPTCIGP